MEWQVMRQELVAVRDQVTALIERGDAAEAAESGGQGIVVGGQGLWTESDVQRVLPELAHLPGVMAMLRVCSERAGEWVSFAEVHEATENTSPRQTRNELARMTRTLYGIRGVNHWPVSVQSIKGRVHYRMAPEMAEWITNAS